MTSDRRRASFIQLLKPGNNGNGSMTIKVKKGYVYRDKNPRMHGRHVLVRSVCDGKAECSRCRSDGTGVNNRVSWIAVKSLQTRFQLVKA